MSKNWVLIVYSLIGVVIISMVLVYTNVFHLPLYILLAPEVSSDEANIYFLTFDIIVGIVGGIVIYWKLRSKSDEKINDDDGYF